MDDSMLSQPPIACSLSPQELTERTTAWQSLLRSSVVARQRVAGGMRLTVRPDAVQAMHALVELEQRCCPWMTFVVSGDRVTVTASGDGEPIVVAMLSYPLDCSPVDKAGASEWLRRYVAAWKSYDRGEIAALFSADATYQYHPFDAPVVGRDAIVESWLEDPRDEPGTYDAAYAPIALAGDLVISNGRSRYFGPDHNVAREYDNIFVMRFDAEGRCREFSEWFMPRRGQTG